MALKISERTKDGIAKFFLEHSVPKILEAKRKEEDLAEEAK